LCHVVRISYKVKVAQLVLFVVSKNKPWCSYNVFVLFLRIY
jgi:hypothetical protein